VQVLTSPADAGQGSPASGQRVSSFDDTGPDAAVRFPAQLHHEWAVPHEYLEEQEVQALRHFRAECHVAQDAPPGENLSGAGRDVRARHQEFAQKPRVAVTRAPTRRQLLDKEHVDGEPDWEQNALVVKAVNYLHLLPHRAQDHDGHGHYGAQHHSDHDGHFHVKLLAVCVDQTLLSVSGDIHENSRGGNCCFKTGVVFF
jgi:hypothetical protein